MKKLFKNRKLVIALVLALIMTMSMAVTVFAETTGGEGSEPKSYWDDPLFFEFVFLVVAFLSLAICSFLIFQAIRNRNKIYEYEEREGTVKLYEDLDDAKWDAPDSVYIDALEPTAAILSELEPVKPIRGLDGFIITEEPIEPVKAINMGADPYAFRRADDISNAVYEATPANPITLGDLNAFEEPAFDVADPTNTPFIESLKQPENSFVYENVPSSVLEDSIHIPDATEAQPIEPAATPIASPYTFITSGVPGAIPFVTPAAALYENSYKPATLEDTVIPVAEPIPAAPDEAVTPLSNPVSYLKDIPITIYTSADEDGVVQINATICENKVTATELRDEPMAPAPEIPMVIPAVATPSAEPVVNMFANVEEPVEIPATEANIFENTVSVTALEDEPEIPVAEIPVVIPAVATPSAEPVVNMFANVEEPVEIPATEANIFENTVSATALEDEPEIPVAEIPVVIPTVATPASDPVADMFANVEEPVEIPATEANIFENTISATALEDEPEIPVAEIPVVIPAVATPASDPVADMFANVEEPVEIPATEANIFENTVSVTALEDEPEIPVAEIPVVIPAVATPAYDPVADMFANVEEPVEIPATEANIFENTVSVTALEDEPEIPVAEIPMVIPAVATPASDPVADMFANVEEPVEIPATEANIFENTISATALEDEPEIPVAEIPVVIPAVATPASDPVVETFANIEEPVVIPTAEAAVFEQTVSNTVLEDEAEEPVVVAPITFVDEATTPASDPVVETFANIEEPVVIPTTEAAVFEQTVSNTVLEDEAEEPVVVAPITFVDEAT
ncbi:MAG: hypothetical protein IJW93_04465, partial [Clostridia bacterium]|nr:hypothetical protein [Clostridia bacterium]